MNSIETNQAAVRVQYHGIKNSRVETEAYSRLAVVSVSSTRQTMPLDCLLLAE